MGVPLGSYRDCRGTVSTLGVPRGICTGGEGACLDSLSDTGIQCIHGVCYREECNVRIYKRLPLRCARRTPPAVSYGDECVFVWEGGYIPPCKIHTGYTWRISQGGVCAIRRIRSYRPSPTSRGGEQLHSAGMYRGCLHWGVPQAAAARL